MSIFWMIRLRWCPQIRKGSVNWFSFTLVSIIHMKVIFWFMDSRHHFLEWMISERPLIISCKYYNPSKWDKWLTRNFYIFIFQGITWGCAYKVTGDSALEYLKQRECTLGKSSQWLDNFCTSTLEVISIHLSRKMSTTDCLSVVFVRRLLFQ